MGLRVESLNSDLCDFGIYMISLCGGAVVALARTLLGARYSLSFDGLPRSGRGRFETCPATGYAGETPALRFWGISR